MPEEVLALETRQEVLALEKREEKLGAFGEQVSCAEVVAHKRF